MPAADFPPLRRRFDPRAAAWAPGLFVVRAISAEKRAPPRDARR
ncbi:MAG: hypothetical protein RET84_10540 [Pseudomonadota bacterium]|nr:hypothetical protein [Pseudomonadota bacterium]